MSGEWDGLRAAAEAATAEMDRLTSAPGGPGQAWRWSIPANPERDSDLIFDEVIRHVPALLDRLQAAEAAVERVRAVAWDWEQDAGPFGTDTFGIARAAQAVTAAVGGPRKHVTEPLSASGAESDHGGRRDGEGLA